MTKATLTEIEELLDYELQALIKQMLKERDSLIQSHPRVADYYNSLVVALAAERDRRAAMTRDIEEDLSAVVEVELPGE